MLTPKVTVVIDFPETPGDFYPVVGRSGLHLGLALHDAKRGCKCLRFSLEQFRLQRDDIFNLKRSGSFPLPDVEVEMVEVEDDEATVAAKKELAELRAKVKKLTASSNAPAKAKAEAKPEETVETPKPLAKPASAKKQPKAAKTAKK